MRTCDCDWVSLSVVCDQQPIKKHCYNCEDTSPLVRVDGVIVVIGKSIYSRHNANSVAHGPHRATLIFYSVHVHINRVGIILTIPRVPPASQ